MENIQTTNITPLEARRSEVAQYEANIVLYQTILSTLPSEYPDHLAQYKGVKNQHEVAASIDNVSDVELLSKLWYADECRNAIRSEIVEMTKAKSILAVLES